MPGPAATLTHMHTCPMYSGTTPHVGGPIIGPGVPNVLIKGKPAAVMGDQCTCSGPPDVIAKGCATVLFGGKPAATMGDTTAHGGVISQGEPTVLIGTGGGGAPSAVMAVEDIPFPKMGFVNKLIGNNKKALANQEVLRQEAESTEGEPKIYGLQWVKEDIRIKDAVVLKEVTLRAHVLNIPDGETITITINKPVINTDTSQEEREDFVELSGTVKNKMVEVVWEVELPEEHEDNPESTTNN